jgi:hypothetical protein
MENLRLTPIKDVVDVDYEGVTLSVARWGNDDFVQRQRDLLPDVEGKTLTARQEREHLARICAGTVLVGWSGLVVDGEDLPFTVDRAENLLKNDRDCHTFVVNTAMEQDKFRIERTNTTAKKS